MEKSQTIEISTEDLTLVADRMKIAVNFIWGLPSKLPEGLAKSLVNDFCIENEAVMDASILMSEVAKQAEVRNEAGKAVLGLLFISNARTIAQAFKLNPDVLISNYEATPMVPRILFWNMVAASIEAVQILYGLSREECYPALADTIAKLLTLPV